MPCVPTHGPADTCPGCREEKRIQAECKHECAEVFRGGVRTCGTCGIRLMPVKAPDADSENRLALRAIAEALSKYTKPGESMLGAVERLIADRNEAHEAVRELWKNVHPNYRYAMRIGIYAQRITDEEAPF
jgi:hypothetical protein